MVSPPRDKPSQSPAEISSGLRAEALSRSAQDLGITASQEHPNVFGILMELGYPQATATLAVFAEGSTSLYFSSGGAVIGAGRHDAVRKTHGPFFAEAESCLGEFALAGDTALPDTGRVRFYLRTFSGTLTAEAGEQDLAYNRHPLSALFHAGHAVITAVRESSGE